MKRQQTAKAKPKRPFKKRRYQQTKLNTVVVAERKYFDAIRSAQLVVSSTTTWAGAELDPATLNCIFAPIQGDDIFNRQGRKVQILAIKISGQIGCDPQTGDGTADFASIIRLHLVQDTQSNGVQLNAEDVFGAVSAVGEPTNMFQNPGFFGRFRVLKSKKFILQNAGITYDTASGGLLQNGIAQIFKMNVKFQQPIIVHYNAVNAGSVADVIDHSFHIIGLTNSQDLAPRIAYRARTTFVDV